MRRDDEQQQPHIIFSTDRKIVAEEPLHLPDAGVTIPLTIFAGELSCLQATVRYLHEHHLSLAAIATLLNRSQKTIWTTFQRVKEAPFEYDETGLTIPVARLASRELSPLETIVNYLTELGFTNAETARLLALDPRTTWTVKHRIAKKRTEVSR
jgi:DNA-binding CsgD family transcriptional regulator